MSATPAVDRRSVVLGNGIDCRLHYRVATPREDTEGTPVVLLHGGGIDEASLSWRDVLRPLAAETGRRVYALDWPGYGGSDPPTDDPTTEYYIGVLDAFLDSVGVDRCALVGISMGGGVAIGSALATPGRVTRLVAVDSYGLGGTVPGGPLGALFTRLPFAALAWRALRRSRLAASLAVRGIVGPGNATPELVADLRRALDRPDAGRAFEGFQRSEVGIGGLRTNYLDRLPALSTPTLFVHGEHDPLVPVSWAVRATVLAPDATLRVLGGCGHWPPREAPDRFLGCVVPFLGE
ncbi:alpha/beta fold hydrolase [Halomarina litorea]|uniref:alpha/beta fold hydrolase n=1 Tax=Halomarina litorea TaxID=2961595 RepID=UPI0020C2AD4C|nr:alpha/beta hydrolase [Halomarina sp. BCD28]